MEHLFDRTRGGTPKDAKHFLITKTALGVNDGGIEPGLQYASVRREKELNALGKAIDIRLEGTQFIAERFREHRDDAVHEVGGIAATAGFNVQGCFGFYVM
jgi:hypothetical protein